MKIENSSRYRETEIVSYVQVINKAEIDRYLQRGKRKVRDWKHWGIGDGGWWWAPLKRKRQVEKGHPYLPNEMDRSP